MSDLTPYNGLLYTNGVHYTFEPKAAPHYFIRYSYQRRHKGEIIDTYTVYCKNARDFLELLRHWNALDNNWVYIPV